MAIIGGMWVGPALHVWFGFLGRTVTFTGHKATLAMLALDQLVWAPPFIASFVALVMTLEGNPSGVPAALRERPCGRRSRRIGPCGFQRSS